MALGIDHSLAFFDDAAAVGVDVVALVKSGISWGSIGKLGALAPKVVLLVQDAKSALPELADVDAEEAGKLSKAAYVCVKKIVEAAA